MRVILLTILTSCMCMFSCKNNTTDTVSTSENPSTAPATNAPSDAVSTVTVPVTGQAGTTNAETVSQPPNTKVEPPQNAQGVWHYTCPKGCKGGGGAAGPCAKCGATLAHNAAYHSASTPPGQIAGDTKTLPADIKQVPPPKVEPPQNAKGVWHFTCPKGCAGGAGSATACAKCGGTLAHNAAYHQ